MTTRTDDPSARPTALVGVTFVVLFVVVILGLQAYFARVQNEELESKLKGVSSEELARFHEEQLSQISEYRWVDRDSGTVAIPIERAMELVVSEESQDSPRRSPDR
jgi:hypothetical protein